MSSKISTPRDEIIICHIETPSERQYNLSDMGQLKLVFTSDKSITGQGFFLRYSISNVTQQGKCQLKYSLTKL